MKPALARNALLLIAAVASGAPLRAQTPVTDLANPLWSLPLARLTQTRDRPLFSPSRRPAPKATAVSDETAPVARDESARAPPPFALIGTVMSGDDQIAILFDKSVNAAVRLHVGASTSGWSLSAVSARSAVLRRGAASTTLTLPAPGEAAPSLFGAPGPATSE
jgi:hypothetical protein